MSMRMGLISICTVVLLAGTLLPSVAKAMREQSGSAASSDAEKPPAITPAKPPSKQELKQQFAKIVSMVRTKGTIASLRSDIAQDLRLTTDPSVHIPVYSIADNDGVHERMICLTAENSGYSLVVMIVHGDQPMIYLATTQGALRQAGKLITGRLKSTWLKDIPIRAAMNGFLAEKDFWMEKAASEAGR